MHVSVQVGRPSGGDPGRLILGASDPMSPLVHAASVGGVVRVGVDLLVPSQWACLSVDRLDPASEVVLVAVVGQQIVHDMAVSDGLSTVDVDPARAECWTRIAVVDAVDRWLDLPLDQSLVDAERGVSRGRAAAGLPDGDGRDSAVGDALGLARGASVGLVRYLRRLGAAGSTVPQVLREALDELVDGYHDLAAEVCGPDRELCAVVDAWRAVRGRLPEDGTPTPRPATRPGASADPDPDPDPGPGPGQASVIDPRQVPARVLGLSADPISPEVNVVAVPGEDVVRVRVPAFRGPFDENRARRLLVRLVDRRTAEPRGHGLLTQARTGRVHGRHFQATVRVAGADVTGLRADVYDASSPLPAATDDDPVVCETRRASAFLRESRGDAAVRELSDGAGSVRGPSRPLVAELAASLDDLRRV